MNTNPNLEQPIEEYREILGQQEKSLAPPLKKEHGLICRQLPFDDDTAALYIAKPHWTNRFDLQRETTIGIFCAIWVSADLLKQQQFAYNIHSIKLRQLPGYKLTSRKFANDFRTTVKATVANWPNIRLDYGPLTLLEGRCESTLDTFSESVSERVNGFTTIHHEIDRLLDDGKV